jgi:transposase
VGRQASRFCPLIYKDNHLENKQVMVDVIMMWEGIPLAHHVFPEKMSDAVAFWEVIDDLSTRLGIQHMILLGEGECPLRM